MRTVGVSCSERKVRWSEALAEACFEKAEQIKAAGRYPAGYPSTTRNYDFVLAYNQTMPSIFTRIINGEIPCHKVYEDDKTLAFLDIEPVAPGHTLVIPKTEVEFVWDLSDKDYEAVMATAKRVAIRLREVTGKPYIGEKVVGIDVPHAHVHLIPFATLDEFFPPTDIPREAEAEPDHEALAAMAKKLAF